MGDDCGQEEVIAFFGDPASYSGVQRVDRFETHGNLVFLAGTEAWKIKRAVRFPYMDFSTLGKRHAACIARSGDQPPIRVGALSRLRAHCALADRHTCLRTDGAIVEWAVHMRRFDQSALLSSIARKTGVPNDLARLLADVVYEAHQRAERASQSAGVTSMRELAKRIAGALSQSGVFARAGQRPRSETNSPPPRQMCRRAK